MKNENFNAEFQTALYQMLTIYTPQEIEDVLFHAFSRANQHSDGDKDETRENREAVHAELRNFFRLIAKNQDDFNKTMQIWTSQRTTEIT